MKTTPRKYNTKTKEVDGMSDKKKLRVFQEMGNNTICQKRDQRIWRGENYLR